MKFKYKRYSPIILRPVIPIVLEYQGTQIKYEVLVDSGADENILDAQIADLLGIDLISGEKAQVSGITGVSKPYYIHKINLIVGGHRYENIRAGFLKNIGHFGYGVVGQRDFFNLFTVKFDLQKEEIEIKTR
jgi:hypothetical protein